TVLETTIVTTLTT
nr:immunoglobulin heavy chain junction region [Mus musculus]